MQIDWTSELMNITTFYAYKLSSVGSGKARFNIYFLFIYVCLIWLKFFYAFVRGEAFFYTYSLYEYNL